MRLSNWCVLFMALFLVSILLPNLREDYFRTAGFTTELYNRNVDRATEDAMIACVKEEYADGSVRIEEDEVTEKFYQQLAGQFDVTTEQELQKLRENVILSELVNEKAELGLEEERSLREMMEQMINEGSKISEGDYCLLFPELESDGWSQPLANKSFYHFVELADEENYPWTKLLKEHAIRFFLSGAKLRKANVQ